MNYRLPSLVLLAVFALPCFGADGTLAHYTFDEGSGSIAHDSSGNGYDGNLVNGPVWTTGIRNGALQFNGSTTYVSVPNSPDVSVSSFSVSAWIFSTASGVDRKFVDKWNDTTSQFQFDCQIYHDDKTWFGVEQTNGIERIARGTTVIQPGRWYHYAAVADTATHQLRIYINGVQEPLQFDPGWDGTIHSWNMEMDIGRKTSNFDYWPGKIDDVRLYSRALSSLEVGGLAGVVVAGTDGNVLDGENNGTGVPSGDGTPGGDYVRTFALSTSKLQIQQTTPAANATISSLSSVTVKFNKDVDAATVTTSTVLLLKPGADGVFGTGDDVVVTPATVSMTDSKTAVLDLSGAQLPNGSYQLRVTGSGTTPVADVNGNILDGDANNSAGGDFSAQFQIQPASPVITSAASATPNPATTGQAVAFAVGAQIASSETLTYAWDFGDGSQGSGNSPTHTYTNAGSFTAVATVFSSASSVSSSVVVVVEKAPVNFTIDKITGSVNFTRSGKDTVKFSGVLPGVTPAFIPLGTIVTVNLSGAAATFTLDKNGQGKTPVGTLVLKPVTPSKSKVKTFGGDLNFTAQLTGSYAAGWGMNAATTVTAQPITLAATIVLNGTTYQSSVQVIYSGKAKASSKFKK